MRTTKYYRLLASIVLVSTLTTYTTSLFAQRRSYNEEATRYEERKRNKSFDENNNRNKSKRSSYNYNDDHRSQRHDSKYNNNKSNYHKNNHNAHKKHNGYKYHKPGHVEYRHYHGDHYRANHRHQEPYYRHKYYYNKHGHSCYNHSKYGQVIWRFSCEPRVIHHQSGDYYYTNGSYYRFYPELGFILVEAPSTVYFSHLPNDCHRVKVHGGVYYTDGDLCFRDIEKDLDWFQCQKEFIFQYNSNQYLTVLICEAKPKSQNKGVLF